ncbi:MAG TPA: class I SAM-dependent methyltransferase [Actinomycetota bacterium]|nr:class I SAM-dependent methyltransferase [Actinomycetota bacterium]
MSTTRDDPRRDEEGATPKPHRLPRPRDLLAAVDGSVHFGHAVGYYDETRGLSPEVQAETARLLAAELPGASRVLEVGAGTGLVTVPLAEAGIPMTGIDLADGMLGSLRNKAAAAGVSVPIAVADAVRLPFGDDVFDGLVMRHVLHLVAGWHAALEEVVRVVRPGGTFLVSITDYTGLYHTLQERFLTAAGGLPIAVGLRPDDPERLEQVMAAHGATGRVLPVVRGRRTLTISAFLRNMERGLYTWTWAASPRTRRHAVREVRRWARRNIGKLDRPVEPEFEIEWRAFRLVT